jgi:hypothetical protein
MIFGKLLQYLMISDSFGFVFELIFTLLSPRFICGTALSFFSYLSGYTVQ